MASLGRDQDVCRVATVGSQRLGDECLVVADFVGTHVVRVGRVDKGDPRVQGGVDRRNRTAPLRTPSMDIGIAPNPIADTVIVPRTRVFMSATYPHGENENDRAKRTSRERAAVDE
jgi:hypothetical protein